MSIATLKRKTSEKYNNSSVGYKNFSINGTTRNQGYVGQTSLSRSLPKTLMRGNTLRGYGGCCGTYRITPIVESAVNSTEDNTVIKSSVLSNYGMIETKYQWVKRPQPFSVVKPDSNRNNNDQASHIFIVQQNALKCNAEINASTNLSLIGKPSNVGCLHLTNDQFPVVCNNVTKSNIYTGAVDQSIYLQNIDNKCSNNKVFPSSTQNTPIISSINTTFSSYISKPVPYSNRSMNYNKNIYANLG
jgi:hypothetical protein